MWSSDSDRELAGASAAEDISSYSTSSPTASPPPSTLRPRRDRRRNRKKKPSSAATSSSSPQDEAEADEPSPEAEDVWRGAQWEAAWPGRARPKKPVVLAEEDKVGRSRSLTDDDLEELKGCADLGFGFSYDEIPELRDTLPALELCYSITQRLLDDDPTAAVQAKTEAEDAADVAAASSAPVTNWKISSPGDSPDEVKARLKYWAQAVACTVRLCS